MIPYKLLKENALVYIFMHLIEGKNEGTRKEIGTHWQTT